MHAVGALGSSLGYTVRRDSSRLSCFINDFPNNYSEGLILPRDIVLKK